MEAGVMTSPVDRRISRRRLAVGQHGIIRARLRPGDEVALLDVSEGGALVEARYRLLPGASVELHLRRQNGEEIVRGRVVRSSVARLRADAVSYRAAIAFERMLRWLPVDESGGYLLPDAEREASAQGGVAITRGRA
jgi:PilZ domain